MTSDTASPPATVLHVVNSLGCGGIQRQLLTVVEHLPGDVYHSCVCSLAQGGFFEESFKSCLGDIHQLDRTAIRGLLLPFALNRLIGSLRPQLVHVWGMPAALVSLVSGALRAPPCPVLLGCIRDAPLRLDGLRRLVRAMLRKQPYVLANSHAGMLTYDQSGLPGRFILYNGFDSARLGNFPRQEVRSELHWSNDEFFIGMVAEMSPWKDHDCFLRSAALCLQQRNDLNFVLIGDGQRQSALRALAVTLGIAGRVHFLGRQRDVERIIQALDVSVLMSTNGEGISNTILETMAAGIPTVAGCGGATAEVIDNGIDGFIVNDGNAAELSRRILLLVGDSPLRRSFAERGAAKVATRFGVERMVGELCAIYRSILTRSGAEFPLKKTP